MKKFKYTAIDQNKHRLSGTFLANTKEDVKKQLLDQNIYMLKCHEISRKAPSAFFSVNGNVGKKELTAFCRQFSIMIESGIPITDCIAVLKEQNFSGYFRRVLNNVHEDLKSGLLLSQSMLKYPKVFPEFFRSMVHVGEVGGSLDRVLINIADYYEMDLKTKKQIKSALAYPALLLGLLVVVIIILMVFVIPTFISSFESLDIEMPAITMGLFNMSNFFVKYWAIILLCLGAFIALCFLFGKTKSGRLFFDQIKVTLPVFKKINIAILTSRFARSFGLLIASGMDMVDALKDVSTIMGNKYIEKRFRLVIDDVMRGLPLSDALEDRHVFTGILNQMIAVGEETGRMDEVLLKTCTYFDTQVQTALNLVTTIIQPVVLVIMGVVIAIVFVAVYAPILSLIQGIS